MHSFRNRIAVILLAIALLLPGSTAAFADTGGEPEKTELQQQMEYLGKMIEFIEQFYVEPVDRQKLVEGAYKGIFDALDPYSTYYTAEEYRDFDIQTSGTYGGTGIHITLRDGEVYIIAPIEGTPAHRAGIKAGDIIVSVDGEDVRDYPLAKVADMIRGEIGTAVKLGIKREGEKDILYFELVREEININPVYSKVLEENIGYIRITDFNGNTAENIEEVLQQFDEQGIKDVVVDLRNNPGGLLDEVVEVCRYFIPEGPVVHIEKRDGNRTTHSSELKEAKYNLAVLVDQGSASASEIFAGAVQDREAGVVVGTTTFGKGTVQTLLPLTNGGALKLTIARYLTPNGRMIDGEGIVPDVQVEDIPWQEQYGDELAPIKGDRKPSAGTIGLDVLGAEQRLSMMGYGVGQVDGIFDEALEAAVYKFQADAGLFPYGVLDFTTQSVLQEKFAEYMSSNDPDEQLQKAIEVLKNK